MGKFKGGAWQDEYGKTFNYMIIWGKVIRNPRVSFGKVARVEFTVKTHTKTYTNCVTWGKTPTANVASALEEGDHVLCIGLWSEREWEDRKSGERKKYSSLNCEIIVPTGIISYALDLMGSPNIEKLLQSDTHDVIESANDDVEDELPQDQEEAEADEFESYSSDDLPFA